VYGGVLTTVGKVSKVNAVHLIEVTVPKVRISTLFGFFLHGFFIGGIIEKKGKLALSALPMTASLKVTASPPYWIPGHLSTLSVTKAL
jgi:hypothetical protein